MKTFLKNLLVIMAVVLGSSTTSAQDNFTVTIPSTDKYSGLCKPEKANISFNLPVNVKSNISDTCTISINVQSSFGTESEWFQVDKENLTIVKNQTITFTLTVKPPAGIQDKTYEFHLYFDATGKSVTNRDFDQNGFTVIVDNSVPSILEFSAPSYGKTSTALQFNWDAYDQWSNYYTMENDTAGISGIARYRIVLKNQNNQEVGSKSYDANDFYIGHTFTGLAPYTQYTAYITAIDVAGNQTTSTGLTARTISAPPTNLRAINTTYFGTTLVWDAAPGATGYEVYNVTSGNTPIGTTATTAFTVAGLSVGSTSRFAVKSVCSEGKSELSGVLVVSTPRPSISGSSALCAEETYSVENFLPGATALWTWSGSLALSSGQGSGSAVFTKSGDGIGLIGATVTFEGQSINLAPLRVSVGAPLRPHINNGSTTSTYSTVNYTLQLGQPTTSLQLFFVDQPSSAFSGQWVVQKTSYPDNFTLVQSDNSVFVTPNGTGTGSFTVKGVNLCGESGVTRVNLTITQSGGHGPIDPPELPLDFAISPNPATEQVCITLQDSELLGYSKSSSESSKLEVQLWSATELIKLVKTGESTVQLPLGGLASGTYYIRVIHNGKVKSKVFFKR